LRWARLGWVASTRPRVAAQPTDPPGPTCDLARPGPQPWNRHKPRPLFTPSTPPQHWTVEGDAPDTLFAYSVAPAGDVNGDGCADVVISEPDFDGGRGRVLAYYGSRAGLHTQPDWTAEGTAKSPVGGQRRKTAEGSGDLNGDGFDDLVVVTEGLGEPANSAPARLRDRVEIFCGGPTGLSAQPAWAFASADLSAGGIAHAGRAGDLNGDGFADLQVMVTLNAPELNNSYAVCILCGSTNGPRLEPKARLDLFPPAFVDRPVAACAGDVNGDGCDDLLVGEPTWSGNSHWGGRALVFHGSPRGLKLQPAWTATYPLPARRGVDEDYEQFFGQSVAGAGDVNHDGFADVIVGAPYADHDDLNEGLAFVYHGSAAGLSREPQWFAESNQKYAALGLSVSPAGDVNGDGFGDVIVGVPRAADGQHNEGAAVVFLGSPAGLAKSPHWSVESDHSEQQLGYVVAAAGDVNGDGYGDVLVAAPDFAREGRKLGRVCLYYGTGEGLTGSFNWRLDKPWLTVLQEWLARTSAAAKLAAFAALLAGMAALAVAWRRALRRALRAERELATSSERARLGRDLHDRLGASLARLSAVSGDPQAPASDFSAAVRQTVIAAQQAVWKVNPTHDTLEGFISSLLQEVDAVFADTPVRCWTEAPENPPALPLADELRDHVSLAVREACANILKHAHATEAWLRITLRDSTLEIVLEDNGIGLATVPVRPGANGLKNLRHRLAAVGGEARFEARPGGGTRVTLRAQLPRR